MNKIICVAGLPGSGKSAVADYFVKAGYQFIRFGQITIDILKDKGLAINEKNERIVRESLRKKYGMAAFAKLNLSKFKKLLKKSNVIADGLYSFEEYELLKKEFKDKVVVIAAYAPPILRYKRISHRKPDKADKKLRNHSFTEKEAKDRDYAQLTNLNMGPTIAMADYTALNTRGKKYLYDQIKKIKKEIEK